MSEDTVRSFLGLFLLGLLSSFGSVVSPVLPQYAEQLGASYMEIGLFFSAYSLTWTFLQLYTGYLSDRYGRRRFVMLGLSIYGLSLILSGFSPWMKTLKRRIRRFRSRLLRDFQKNHQSFHG